MVRQLAVAPLDRALRSLVVRSGKPIDKEKKKMTKGTVKGRYPFWNNVSLLQLYKHLPAGIRTAFDVSTMQAHVKAVRRAIVHSVQVQQASDDSSSQSGDAHESKKTEKKHLAQMARLQQGCWWTEQMQRAFDVLLTRGRPGQKHPMLDYDAVTRRIETAGLAKQTRNDTKQVYHDFMRIFAESENVMPLTMANVYAWQDGQSGAFSTRKKHANLFAGLWKRVMPWAPLERHNLVFRRNNEVAKNDPHAFTLAQSAYLAKMAVKEWNQAYRRFKAVKDYWHPLTAQLDTPKVAALAVAPKRWKSTLGVLYNTFIAERGGKSSTAGSIQFIKLEMRRTVTSMLDLSLIIACMALGCRPREFAHAFLNVRDARIVHRIKYLRELRDNVVPTIQDTRGNEHPMGDLQFELAGRFVKTGHAQLWYLPVELHGWNVQTVWDTCKDHLCNGHRMLIDRDPLSVKVSADSRRTSASKLFKTRLRGEWTSDASAGTLKLDLERSVLYTTRKTLITQDYLMQLAASKQGEKYVPLNPGKHTEKTAMQYYRSAVQTDCMNVQYFGLFIQVTRARECGDPLLEQLET